MALESAIFMQKSALTYFQAPTYQISLFPSLSTLDNFSSTKLANDLL